MEPAQVSFSGVCVPGFSAGVFPSAPGEAAALGEFSPHRRLGVAELLAAIALQNPTLGGFIAGVHRQLASGIDILGLAALGAAAAPAGGGHLPAGGPVVRYAPPVASGSLVLYGFFVRHRHH